MTSRLRVAALAASGLVATKRQRHAADRPADISVNGTVPDRRLDHLGHQERGNYPLTFRYANGTTINRPMDTVNGSPAAPGLAFNGTGAWTASVEQTITASLPAGANTVRAQAGKTYQFFGPCPGGSNH